MNFFKSFSNALRGIFESIKTGRNLRIQLVAGLYVFSAAPFFLESKVEWALLSLAVALVLGGEIFNTAIEHLTDLSTGAYAPLARAAKDAAAGAVLIFSVFSLIIAGFLFIRPDGFSAFFAFCGANLWYPALLILFLPLSGFFIFKK